MYAMLYSWWGIFVQNELLSQQHHLLWQSQVHSPHRNEWSRGAGRIKPFPVSSRPV